MEPWSSRRRPRPSHHLHTTPRRAVSKQVSAKPNEAAFKAVSFFFKVGEVEKVELAKVSFRASQRRVEEPPHFVSGATAISGQARASRVPISGGLIARCGHSRESANLLPQNHLLNRRRPSTRSITPNQHGTHLRIPLRRLELRRHPRQKPVQHQLRLHP